MSPEFRNLVLTLMGNDLRGIRISDKLTIRNLVEYFRGFHIDGFGGL